MMDPVPVLDSGNVVRYHCALIDQKQLNSSHQWEVAIILRYIYPEASADLLFHALTHDVAEMITGDLPSPIKKKYPQIKAFFDDLEEEYRQELIGEEPPFTAEEKLAVKHADVLSGIYFTTHRVNCGDKAAVDIRNNWILYYKALPPLNDNTEMLFRSLV